MYSRPDLLDYSRCSYKSYGDNKFYFTSHGYNVKASHNTVECYYKKGNIRLMYFSGNSGQGAINQMYFYVLNLGSLGSFLENEYEQPVLKWLRNFSQDYINK